MSHILHSAANNQQSTIDLDAYGIGSKLQEWRNVSDSSDYNTKNLNIIFVSNCITDDHFATKDHLILVPLKFTIVTISLWNHDRLHVGWQLIEILIPIQVHQLLIVDAELPIWIDRDKHRTNVCLQQKQSLSRNVGYDKSSETRDSFCHSVLQSSSLHSSPDH